MKLGDIPFEESIEIEMTIAPIAERIMQDEDMIDILNQLQDAEKERSTSKRVKINRELTKCLLQKHLDDICEMVGALNKIPPEDVKGMRRSLVSRYLTDIFTDRETMSFFMSYDMLEQAAQSATSQMLEEESPEAS